MFQAIEPRMYRPYPQMFAFWIHHLGSYSISLATIEHSSHINSTDSYISLQVRALSKFWHLWASWHLHARLVAQFSLLIGLSPTDTLYQIRLCICQQRAILFLRCLPCHIHRTFDFIPISCKVRGRARFLSLRSLEQWVKPTFPTRRLYSILRLLMLVFPAEATLLFM